MKNLFETGQEPTMVEEPVNQEPQEQVPQQENFDNWDKQKAVEAYRNLQKKTTELDLTVKQLAEEKIRAEERARVLEEFATKSKETPQIIEDPEPQIPSKPIKPQGYNKADAIAYPDSESGKYEEAKEKYEEAVKENLRWRNEQLNKKVQSVTQTLEQKENERLQNEEFARRKANQIARLSKATGGDIEKAGKVFEFVQNAMGKDDPAWFVKLYDQANTNPQVALKTEQAAKRNERQQFVAPGATVQGEGENAKIEQSFIQSISSRRKNNHGLFATEKK